MTQSEKNLVFLRLYLFLKNFYLKLRLFLIRDDKTFARKRYYERIGRELNLDNPTSFNEKIWWLKLNNRDPLLTICSDKVKVRDYVKECGLEHILIKSYGSFNKVDDIDFEELPDKVFIKCNHGSGTNTIYNREEYFDVEKFKIKFEYALKQNYYLKSREWNYKNIEPKLIVEEILEDKRNKQLIDYRFMCFNGTVKMIFVDVGTAAPDGSHSPFAKRNIYDRNFNYLNVKIGREQYDINSIKKPENFNEMVEYAEILSKPFPHCRVDLYNIDGKIFFGEMTFYHGGGGQKIEPKEWDEKMGSWIDLKSEKIRTI